MTQGGSVFEPAVRQRASHRQAGFLSRLLHPQVPAKPAASERSPGCTHLPTPSLSNNLTAAPTSGAPVESFTVPLTVRAAASAVSTAVRGRWERDANDLRTVGHLSGSRTF